MDGAVGRAEQIDGENKWKLHGAQILTANFNIASSEVRVGLGVSHQFIRSRKVAAIYIKSFHGSCDTRLSFCLMIYLSL
jgi:hypothetical protein